MNDSVQQKTAIATKVLYFMSASEIFFCQFINVVINMSVDREANHSREQYHKCS